MSAPAAAPRRVAVVGGGITGLAAAHRLRELDPSLEVHVFEAGPRLGGVIQTRRIGDFLVECGPDNFITNVPWGVELCRRLELLDELLPTDAAHRRALVVRRGRLLPIPEGFTLMSPGKLWPVLTTRLLSPWGKVRLMCEYFIPRRRNRAEESLAAFARRRLGREVYQRLVEPLVAGIYTADPEQLSVQAALPRFAEMEQTHGSLIRAARREARRASSARGTASPESGARYGLFVTLRDGMSRLVDALAARLGEASIHLRSAVQTIARDPQGRWQVPVVGAAGNRSPTLDPRGASNPCGQSAELPQPATGPCSAEESQRPSPASEPATVQTHVFDGVLLAVPAYWAAEQLRGLDPLLADGLAQIPYASSAVVSLGYARTQIAHRLDAFGVVVPHAEQRPMLAASFSSVKYPGRAPAGQVLIRVFLGGALNPQVLDGDDAQLQRIAHEELSALLGIAGDPLMACVCRWPRSMPQYHVGHLERLALIQQRLTQWPTLQLAGAAYEGVGIPACIHQGERAAERLVQALAAPRGTAAPTAR
jgi:oxygen-dependent protoporphyrinogen oxidase